MFRKNKEKGKSGDEKKKNKTVRFENIIEKIKSIMPMTKDEDENNNSYSQRNTFHSNDPEFEVWRAVKDNKNDINTKNNKKESNLILTEYLEKTDKNENKTENSMKVKKIENDKNNEEGLNLIEDYFDKGNPEITSNENDNIDEDYSDNSDKEIDITIHKQRENENDDDDDEDDKNYEETKSNKSASKKTSNSKIIVDDVDNKAEYPEFDSECKYYGENNKDKYKVKIKINSSFYIYFHPQMNRGFKNYNSEYYQFPLLAIKNYITTKKKGNFLIDLVLKDYRHFSFKLFTVEDFNKFNNIIKEFGMPNQNVKYFQHAYYNFNVQSKKEKSEKYINGWEIYNDEKEFIAQNLDFKNTFRIVDNSKFDFCSSYPKKIVVPISMSDDDIKKCGTYRTKERIPALTYRYKNGRCIWRSSQTKSGIKGKTNKDVILLTKIAEGSKKLFVFDARPLLNAWANKLKGAGYEDISQYPDINMELLFCGIPNIHAVRGACHKVYSTLCYKNENEDKKSKAKNNMDSGNWYDSIIILIKGAFQIVETIKDDNTVLIHCSDGWDRTTQLSCTSQLILEKRYRTLNGFICLIEKDWLSFGHQFRYRCGMYCPTDSPSNVASENQKSPIFIQWLDAVYQIMHQNMTKFQFNTDLLYFLANEMFTGKYGTFLFNNEKEREEYDARKKTVSIWTYVKENENKFINPIYEENDYNPFVMNYKRIQLWSKYFFRFEDGDDYYNEKISKVINDLNNKNINNTKIINELITFIKKECPSADISSLSKECQKLINNNK